MSNFTEHPIDTLRIFLEALQISSKFAFKNDTEQNKIATALSIFIDQHNELDAAYEEINEKLKGFSVKVVELQDV